MESGYYSTIVAGLNLLIVIGLALFKFLKRVRSSKCWGNEIQLDKSPSSVDLKKDTLVDYSSLLGEILDGVKKLTQDDTLKLTVDKLQNG